MAQDLDRLARLSGLIRQLRVGAAGAARARIATLQEGLTAPALTAPPGDADPDTAAQHARWAAARRAALARDLALAQGDLIIRTAAARHAIGVDDALGRLAGRLADERRRKARRD